MAAIYDANLIHFSIIMRKCVFSLFIVGDQIYSEPFNALYTLNYLFNLFLNLILFAAVLPFMMKAGYGHIVAVSSVQGKISIPFRSACKYLTIHISYFISVKGVIKIKCDNDVTI